jgi:enterochelin esterase-like enzyme
MWRRVVKNRTGASFTPPARVSCAAEEVKMIAVRRPWPLLLMLVTACAHRHAATAPAAAAGPAEGEGDFTIDGPYAPPPEATPAPDLPHGRVESFEWSTSTIFPDTTRPISVYIPAQYKEGTEAALMVLQDGPSYLRNFKMDVVLDHLIARKEVPVIVAVFVGNGGRAHRSAEYDSLGPQYSRFVLEEILPEVQRRYPVKFTADPEGRCAGGHSSGGIAAFTMGWERPDQFHRILTHSGSFVDLRGGHVYPDLIRANPPRPLRVFLFSGTGDNGASAPPPKNWPIANRAMAAALAAKGYHYRFVFANGGTHNQSFPASVLPQTLIWLWRGYPR